MNKPIHFFLLHLSVLTVTLSAVEIAPLFTQDDRIAISSDGNLHDADDISATAATLALLAASDEKERLVYYGHSDHIWEEPKASRKRKGKNGDERMDEVISRSIEVYGYKPKVFFDVYSECRELDASFEDNKAVSALVKEINQSTPKSRLWIVQAGPLEVIAIAIRKSQLESLKHVVLVSHSQWNNGHAHGKHGATSWAELKDLIIENGGTVYSGAGAAKVGKHKPQFDKPRDQNGILKRKPNAPFEGLSTEYLEKSKMKPWVWMKNHEDPRIKFMWDAHMLGRPSDISDAGMIYYLLTGDDETDPQKFRKLIESGFE